MKKNILLFALLFLVGFTALQAQDNDTSKPLQVGLLYSPPFVYMKNGFYNGIAVDLWKQTALKNNFNYEFIPLEEDVAHGILQVKEKKLDLLLGPVSITEKRSLIIDYSTPYFLNFTGLAISKSQVSLWSILKYQIPTLLGIMGAAIFVYILFVYLLCFFEKKTSEEIGGYKQTFAKLTWEYLITRRFVTITVPQTFIGKIILVVGTISLGILVASLIASITSSITVARALTIDKFSELQTIEDKRIAAVKGTNNVEIATREGANVVEVRSLKEGLDLLSKAEVDGVVSDHPLLKVEIGSNKKYKDIRVSQLNLGYDMLGFVLSQNSPILQKVNHDLLYLQDEKYAKLICEKYIGEDAKYCDI